MTEYFTSFVIKKRTNDGSNHVNIGYGQMISEVYKKCSAEDVIERVITSISKEWDIEKNMVHITQFNKV